MEVSLNWIKKYVDLGDENSIDTLSKALTSLGFEVEGCRTQGAGIDHVVVAEVVECEKHPEADKLSVCKVTDGIEIYPVVCGAPNVAKGQKVLFAKVGAELPAREAGGEKFKIKKAKLRGQDSHGMICAEDELGLGESHAGILVLDPSLPLGLSFQKIPGLCDTLFEINVTPNRPDALCHIGVARELAAKFGKPLRYPTAPTNSASSANLQASSANSNPSSTSSPNSAPVKIHIENGAGCSLYTGRIIQGVKVGPSPEWLVKALKSLGKRSINNVVDLTNYVLFEYGQPSHAFDLNKISGSQNGSAEIFIRQAKEGEKLLTLDSIERELTAKDLVIADAAKALVLAGVMGGKDSEVDESTTDLFLEVAYFDPATIRRQGRRHGLSSDSSYRFERGVDPLNIFTVSDYLSDLIVKTCGGKILGSRMQAMTAEHPAHKRLVNLRPSRVEKLLGISLTSAEIIRRLESIELQLVGAPIKDHIDVTDPALSFAIPGYRGDLEREADLIEEVARLGDYNNIPAILPSLPLGFKSLPASESLSQKIKHYLRDAGLNETLNLRFSSRKALGKLGLGEKDPRLQAVVLKNPISEEWEQLPSTSLPSLLQAVGYNQKNQERDCRFFEIGKCFYHHPEERGERLPGIWEEDVIYITLSGSWPDRRPWSLDVENATVHPPVEFAHLKGLLENLLRATGVNASLTSPSREPYLHPQESGMILANLESAPEGAEVVGGWKRNAGKQKLARIGSFGVLHPRTLAEFDLKGPVLVAEISLSGLLAAEKRSQKFSSFGQFSQTSRDLNLIVDEAVQHGMVLSKMPVAKIPNLQEVKLNSVYRGTGVPEGKKALHYSFYYRHTERTLTDEEVNKAQEKLNAELAKDAIFQF